MNCDVGEVTESLENEHSSFPNPSLALPTSQLILQPFCCFTYVTAHSPILLSLLLRHRIFTYVTWRAAHDKINVRDEIVNNSVADLQPETESVLSRYNACLAAYGEQFQHRL